MQKLHEVLPVDTTPVSLTPLLTRDEFMQITQTLKASLFSSENGNSNRYIPLFEGGVKLIQRAWRTMTL